MEASKDDCMHFQAFSYLCISPVAMKNIGAYAERSFHCPISHSRCSDTCISLRAENEDCHHFSLPFRRPRTSGLTLGVTETVIS